MSSPTETGRRFEIVRRYPADLAAVSLTALVCYYAVTTLSPGSTLRVGAAIPLLFFLPGFALVSIFFPATERSAPPGTGGPDRPRGVDSVERLGLSFAVSIAILPVIAIIFGITAGVVDVGLERTPAAAALAGLTVVAAQLGVVRRLRLPPEERFVARPFAWIDRLGYDGRANVASLSTVLLIAAVCVAAGALVFALASPLAGAEYTQLALYGEDEDGEYVAGELPEAVEPDAEIPMALEVANNEGEERNYTVVIQQQRVDDGTVQDRTELDRIEYRLDDGEIEREELTIQPTAEDNETVRIVALLYDADAGDVPATPGMDDADHDVYFWTHVTEDPDDDGDIVVGEAGEDDAADDDAADDGEVEEADDDDDDVLGAIIDALTGDDDD